MNISRISDSVLGNNLWLLGTAAVLALLIVWTGIYGSSRVLRWLLRSSRVPVLERLADRIGRLGTAVAVITSAVVILGAIGLLGYGVWQNHDYQPWFDEVGRYLTPGLVWQGAKKMLAVSAVAMVCFYVWRMSRAFLPRLEEQLGRRALLANSRDSLAGLFAEIPAVLALSIMYGVTHWLVQALHAPQQWAWVAITICYIPLVMYGGRFLIQLGWLTLEIVDEFMVSRLATTRAKAYFDKARKLMPLARRLLKAIVYLTCATLLVRRFETLKVFGPFGKIAIEVLLIFFMARLLIELVSVLLNNALLPGANLPAKVADSAVAGPSVKLVNEADKRRTTLVTLLQRLVRGIIYIIMVMVMLVTVGVNPVPLLAGAGIVGFAIGLASQKILEDVICGFFMLFEDQLLVSDYIRINETEGIVEQCHLRVTKVRDRYGRIHTMRNGDIANVINYSRGWTKAVVEMSVAYEADIDKVVRVMTEVGKKLHETLPDMVLAPSEIMGIEALDDSCLRVRTETRVHAGCHYHVKRVHHELLFKAFTDNDLEIPYPKAIEFDAVPGTSEAMAG